MPTDRPTDRDEYIEVPEVTEYVPEEEVLTSEESTQCDLFGDVEDENEFLRWICDRIIEEKGSRGEKEDMWSTWRRHREIRTDVATRDYPWPDSANVSVPITNITSSTVVGQLRGTFSLDPFFTAVRHNKKDKEAAHKAEALTKYLDVIGKSPFELDIHRKARRLLSEAGPMGTCFAKVLWERKPWTFKNDEGAREQGLLHDGVAVRPIPLEDAFYEGNIQDVQRTQWFAERIMFEKYEIQNYGKLGVMVVPEILEDWPDVLEEQQSRKDEKDRHGDRGVPRDIMETFEVNVAWDVDNDGLTEECEFLIHVPTKSILRGKITKTGIRTIVPIVYIEREFFIEGMGTCWLTEDMQEEGDTIHRMRLNDIHISTLNMFVAKRQRGIKAREKLYPGKVFILNSSEDIKPLKHGQVYQDSLAAENMAMSYAQRASLASDIQSGFADSTIRSRDTMGGQNQRLQQNNKMFSSVVQTMKERFSELGQMILFVLVAHKDDVIEKEQMIGRMDDNEIEALKSALDVELEEIPTKFTFTVRSTDVEQTFNEKRQNLLFRVQLESMFHQRLMQATQIMDSPEVGDRMKLLATQMFTASCRTFEKILEFFDEFESDRYVPEYEQMEMFSELMQRMQDAQYGQMAQQAVQGMMQGGNSGKPRLSQPRGMGGSQSGGAQRPSGPGVQGATQGPQAGQRPMGAPGVPGGMPGGR